MIAFDIPEIRMRETELVATWRHRPAHRTSFREVECRTYAGHYYYQGGEGDPMTMGRLQFGIMHQDAYSGMGWYEIARHAWFYDGYKQKACRAALLGETPRPHAKNSVVLANDRDVQLEKAINGLNDLVFIDDALWCRARAPRVSLSIWGDPDRRYGPVTIVAAPMPGSPAGKDHPMERMRSSDEFSFRLDEIDVARDFADRMGITCENQLSEIKVLKDIETGISPEAWLTLKRARDVIASVGADVGSLPLDVVSAWLDLRSVVDDPDTRSSDDVDEKMQTLQHSLGHIGYEAPELTKYFVEIEAMRSMAVAYNRSAGPVFGS